VLMGIAINKPGIAVRNQLALEAAMMPDFMDDDDGHRQSR